MRDPTRIGAAQALLHGAKVFEGEGQLDDQAVDTLLGVADEKMASFADARDGLLAVLESYGDKLQPQQLRRVRAFLGHDLQTPPAVQAVVARLEQKQTIDRRDVVALWSSVRVAGRPVTAEGRAAVERFMLQHQAKIEPQALSFLHGLLQGLPQRTDDMPRENGAEHARLVKLRAQVRAAAGQSLSRSPEHDPIAFDDLSRLLGARASINYLTAARRAASDVQWQQLQAGELTLGAFFRLVGDGLFGDEAKRPVTYIDLRTKLDGTVPESDFERMMSALDRDTRDRFMLGDMTPEEVFTLYAIHFARWSASPDAGAFRSVATQMVREHRAAELDPSRVTYSAAERHALLRGSLPLQKVSEVVSHANSRHVDIGIIGSGAAGLKAGLDITGAGRSTVVLEARARPGGRTLTDSTTFDHALDHGAAYVHNPDKNVLMPMLIARGFHLEKTREHAFYFDGTQLIADQGNDDSAVLDRMVKEVQAAAEKGIDVPVTEVVTISGPFDKMVLDGIALGTFGVEANKLSTIDMARKIPEVYGDSPTETGDRFVHEGLGTLVASFAHGLPIKYKTPAQTVYWNKDEARVVSADGSSFTMKKLIITAPPAVLAKGGITFVPPLSETKMDAFRHLQNGHFKKIFLEFEEGAFGDVPPSSTIEDMTDSRISYIIGPSGSKQLVFAIVGGDLSEELEEKGKEATYNLVIDKLKKIIGPQVDGKFKKGWVSGWESDPLTGGGAYSVAEPGHANAREIAKEPVDNVLFFAGEAYSDLWRTYLPGAYETGAEAAAAALAALPAKDE